MLVIKKWIHEILTSMKSYQVIEDGLPLEEIISDKPIPKGKEVLIRTIACGVCHSDVHIHDGYFDAGNDEKIPSRLTQPLAMGHEIYGELSVDLMTHC